MGRTRKTTDHDVLIAARDLFWQFGYGAVGTRQIEAVTGLTRFTLQTVYKGKMALYLRVLDDYIALLDTRFLSLEGPRGLEPLTAWFARRSNPEHMPKAASFGCLMMNAVIEFHGGQPEVNQRAQRYLGVMKTFFHNHLAGHVRNPAAKADVLVASTLGLNAVIRASGDMMAGQALSASIVAMIDEWGAAQ